MFVQRTACPGFNSKAYVHFVTAAHAGQCPSNFCLPNFHQQKFQHHQIHCMCKKIYIYIKKHLNEKKSFYIILWGEWILCCYESPGFESYSGISLEWQGDSCFIVCVLHLREEAIDVTYALQLQLRLTEYKSNKSLESQWAPEKSI